MRDVNPAEARHLGADAMPPHHSHHGVCAWCDYEGRVFPELLYGCSYDCWAELYQAQHRLRRWDAIRRTEECLHCEGTGLAPSSDGKTACGFCTEVESETDPGTLTDPDTYHEEKNQ